MEEYRYTSTHPVDHTGPETGSRNEFKSYEPFVADCLGYSMHHKMLHSKPNHILLTYCILCACCYLKKKQTFPCKKLIHKLYNPWTETTLDSVPHYLIGQSVSDTGRLG